MKKLPQLLPFLAGWIVLLLSSSFQTQAAVNGALQVVLFLFVVCIPAWRIGRMSYVDIGWPWGLVLIGAVTWALSDGDPMRVAMVCGLYAFMGGRMGFFALKLWRAGVLERELARYRYQAVRWQRAGIEDVAIAKQIEVLAQGFANASFLAVPAFLIAANPEPESPKQNGAWHRNRNGMAPGTGPSWTTICGPATESRGAQSLSKKSPDPLERRHVRSSGDCPRVESARRQEAVLDPYELVDRNGSPVRRDEFRRRELRSQRHEAIVDRST